MAVREELVISRSRTFRSRLAFAASSFICSNEWLVFVGLCTSDSTSSDVECDSSRMSSGVETGKDVVIKLASDIGGGDAADSNEPLDIRLVVFDSGESTLAERPWLLKTRCPFSMLALPTATIILADCPRVWVCGLVAGGSTGALLSDARDACCSSF